MTGRSTCWAMAGGKNDWAEIQRRTALCAEIERVRFRTWCRNGGYDGDLIRSSHAPRGTSRWISNAPETNSMPC